MASDVTNVIDDKESDDVADGVDDASKASFPGIEDEDPDDAGAAGAMGATVAEVGGVDAVEIEVGCTTIGVGVDAVDELAAMGIKQSDDHEYFQYRVKVQGRPLKQVSNRCGGDQRQQS